MSSTFDTGQRLLLKHFTTERSKPRVAFSLLLQAWNPTRDSADAEPSEDTPPLADLNTSSQQVVEVGDSLPVDDAMGTKAISEELERIYDDLMEGRGAEGLEQPAAAALLENTSPTPAAAEPAADVTGTEASAPVADVSPDFVSPSSQPVLADTNTIHKSKAHEERGPST